MLIEQMENASILITFNVWDFIISVLIYFHVVFLHNKIPVKEKKTILKVINTVILSIIIFTIFYNINYVISKQNNRVYIPIFTISMLAGVFFQILNNNFYKQ